MRFDYENIDPRSESNYKLLIEFLEKEFIKACLFYKNKSKQKHEKYSMSHSPYLQVLEITKYGLFDENYYLSTYKDIAATKINPLWHYVIYGEDEGRSPNAIFDPNFYRRQLLYKGSLPCTALYHYSVVGEAAGLCPSPNFNPQNYLISNDLGSWIDRPLTHFLWIGRFHGLLSSPLTQSTLDQKIKINRQPSPQRVLSNGRKRGINIIGPLHHHSGLGVSARGYLDGLQKTGFGPVGTLPQKRWFGIEKTVSEDLKSPIFYDEAAINLVHMNGDAISSMINDGFGEILDGRYNVAVWYWELPALRPEWQAAMEYFHEFWAPTPFIANTIKQYTTKLVRVVPPYLSYLLKPRPKKKEYLSSPHFVYCFDTKSVLERKNPGILLDAFTSAFPTPSNARLTFKITSPDRSHEEVDRLYAASDTNANIDVISRLLSNDELHDLIASATAYVSPHRSEGLGLTIIEAMGFQTPVIATPFGGPAHLLTSDMAWPLDYKLVELADDYFPYPRGYVWADPQITSLIYTLREVANNKKIARDRAKRAYKHVINCFSSDKLISIYRNELERIFEFNCL